MSFPLDITSLSQKERDHITTNLQVRQELTEKQKQYNTKPKIHKTYKRLGTKILLPMRYVKNELNRECKYEKPKMYGKFHGKLEPEQKKIVKEAIIHLNDYRTTVISAAVGIGKTVMSIYLTIHSKMRAMILCHRKVLLNQWKKEIEEFTNAKVQIVTSKDKIDTDVQFILLTPTTVASRNYTEFSDFGVCIVDELHAICTQSLSQCFYYIFPTYLIGLSATPYREDGMDGIIHTYYGRHLIYRELKRKHNVYQIFTDFQPTIERAVNGTMNWNTVLKTQAESSERNSLIAKIIKKYKDLNFLVLVKRISQGEEILRLLEGETTTSLLGTQDTYDKDARILVATFQKVSAGFSHKKLNALMLCADTVQYFIQTLGRVFRTKEVVPTVFDIIDNQTVLKNHAKVREKVYNQVGGVIKSKSLKI